MMTERLKVVVLLLVTFISICHGFDKEGFLKRYCKKDSYTASFRFHFDECLICSDVQFTEKDTVSFETNNFDITDEKVVVFDRGNVGDVNSDFFKQFPSTKELIFNNVSMSLKPSKKVDENKILDTLGILQSNVSGILKTNAFHSLVEMKKFVMNGCNLTNATIDGELLKMNKNLVDLTLSDIEVHPTPSNPLLLKKIDEDALDGLDNIEILYLSVHNMTESYPKWYVNKKIREALILCSLKKFPEGLPNTIVDLDLSFSKIEHITNEDFKNLKKLQRFSMCHGELEVIDENAFDDLLNLEKMFLNKNQIKSFTAGHLSNLTKLRLLGIGNNPISNLKFLDDLGFKKQLNETREGYYERPETV